MPNDNYSLFAYDGWAAEAIGFADLQAVLRERYPAAVVRRRELAGEGAEVWYVSRDGRWVARPARAQRAGLVDRAPGPRR